MCQKFPGPRCSGHAKELLTHAEKMLTEALDKRKPGLVRSALELHDLAQAEYDATPNGLDELTTQAHHAYGNSRFDEGDALQARWSIGDIKRKKAVQAFKMLEEYGRYPELEEKPTQTPDELLQARQKAHQRALNAIAAHDEQKEQEKKRREEEQALRQRLAEETDIVVSEAQPLNLAKQSLRKRAEKNREDTYRRIDGDNSTTPNSYSDVFADAAFLAGRMSAEAISNPENPIYRNSKARTRILKELGKVEAGFNKLGKTRSAALGNPTQMAQLTRVEDELTSRATHLNYQMDLLSTSPIRDEHPQVTQDRKAALKRWSLMGSIEKLLA